MTDAQAFARSMQRDLDAFISHRSPGKQARRPRPAVSVERNKAVLMVKLIVREKHIAPDVPFFYTSDSISQLEAEFEARQAAKAAGYAVFGYVVYIKRGTRP